MLQAPLLSIDSSHEYKLFLFSSAVLTSARSSAPPYKTNAAAARKFGSFHSPILLSLSNLSMCGTIQISPAGSRSAGNLFNSLRNDLLGKSAPSSAARIAEIAEENRLPLSWLCWKFLSISSFIVCFYFKTCRLTHNALCS